MRIVFLVTLFLAVRGQELKSSDINEVIQSLDSIKQAVDASAKEQWEALQSLRFHLMSTRSGLKQALKSIKGLKDDLKNCQATVLTVSSVGQQPTSSTAQKIETRVTTPVPPSCDWPGEMVGSRCIAIFTGEMQTWNGAQEYCKTINGQLVGPEDLDIIRDHLTTLFGVNSDSRVRWSMWAGAQQTMNGWGWTNGACSAQNISSSDWSPNEPHHLIQEDLVPHCMAMDGFNDYRGKSTPCEALRRFVCDVTFKN